MNRDWASIPQLHTAEIELPDEVRRLYDLAYNLWWTWEPRARSLFNAVDSRTWALYRNPVQLLLGIDKARWSEKLEDEHFMGLYQSIVESFDRYVDGSPQTWWSTEHGQHSGPIAYFCMEFGIHHSLALYSGGLGVLAGDHLKSASDLGVPLVGVGLLYRNGYFRQTIDANGRQQHLYPEMDFGRLPLRPAAGHTGREVIVSVPIGAREVAVQVWVAEVGRVPLVLLDTDILQNDSADRPITSTLYTPGREMRLLQEIVLGVGGVRALAALGIEPQVWHMNEGHSALLQFERLRPIVTAGRPLEDAVAEIRRDSVFTSHTPVPAGNESFDHALASRYFAPWCEECGLDVERWLALGNADHGESGQPFNMTALAVRTSSRLNGVSRLNSEVAGRMWSHLLPETLPAEERMTAVTNGVHPATWLGIELQEMFARWFGERWPLIIGSETGRVAILDSSDEDLWRAHQAQAPGAEAAPRPLPARPAA